MTGDPPKVFSVELGTSGPRLVFLHGLFGQGKNWTAIAKQLAGAARVTLLDLPDHGRSAWTRAFSYPAMADDVGALLAEQGRGEPYTVIGHSMGGKVAMALALRTPGLVDRLCVVDASPVASLQVGQFDAYVTGMRSLDLKTLPDRTSADRQLTAHVPDPTIRSFLLQNLRRTPHPDGGPAWYWQQNLSLLGDHLEEIGGWPDLSPARYDGPVLWLAGADSPYVQPAYAPAMRALFPHVRLVTVKNAGHWLHSDQPGVFVAAIRRFAHLG